MRNGKMMETVRETLKHLLNELISPRNALHIGSFYKVGYWFRNENDADIFKRLLFFKIGFNGIRVESHTTYRRTPGYLIYITWHESEQEELIKNIERYLQEDNMGPTNVSRENTKFYAIVEDAEGKKTAYEITHSSLESSLEWGCSGSYIHHTLRFDQEDMRKCDCVFTEWVTQKDELEKLRAENEKLKTRLGNCENQLRSACEFLNGYGDVHIDIPTELKNLDYFSRIVNYETNGETKRREFGKKVADNLKKIAKKKGIWKLPENPEMAEENWKICDDAVESAINPFYIPNSIYLDLTAGIDLSGTITSIDTDAIYVQQRKSGSSKAMEMIKDMIDKEQLKIRLNSIYGDLYNNSRHYSKELMNAVTATLNWDVYNAIKDVKFANPATIVFWKDGTKTVVKAQGDEEYVPEVGLAMCIRKKVMGNTRDYYRVFKHWMKKAKED